jgi:hypothetical protein
MIELTPEEKMQLINQRLRQFVSQVFNLELDLVAYQATNNEQGAQYAQSEIVKQTLAYNAVLALLPIDKE